MTTQDTQYSESSDHNDLNYPSSTRNNYIYKSSPNNDESLTLEYIWDDPMVQKIGNRDNTSSQYWSCLHFDRELSQWNSTKTLYHFTTGHKKNYISKCKSINTDERKRYQILYEMF